MLQLLKNQSIGTSAFKQWFTGLIMEQFWACHSNNVLQFTVTSKVTIKKKKVINSYSFLFLHSITKYMSVNEKIDTGNKKKSYHMQ